MGDWQPLSSQSELARYLAPVPRAAPAQLARPEPQPARAEPQPSRDAAPAADVNWKPVGASALAALASEEIAARAAPEPKPAPARAPLAGGARSIMDGLPDGGGVDPTGAIPLSIKGLETTGEKKIERRSSIASRAEETRHRRSMARVVAIAAVVVLVVVGGAAAFVLWQMRKVGAAPAAPVAVVQPPEPPAAAPASAAAPATPAPPAPALAPPPTAAAAPPAPPPAKAAPAEEPPRRVAKAEPPRPARREPQRREPPPARVQAEPPEERAPPAPVPASAKKKDGLLDFDSSDSALDEALGGGGGTGRSVYVPPARAGAPALPDKLSAAQINEAVAGRIDSLRKCVSDQKARDPSASGVLKMRWVIGGDGNVRDVKTLTGEYATSPFAQCITGVVKSIRFPRSETAGQEVTFPFSF
jgi:hypothetical protein